MAGLATKTAIRDEQLAGWVSWEPDFSTLLPWCKRPARLAEKVYSWANSAYSPMGESIRIMILATFKESMA